MTEVIAVNIAFGVTAGSVFWVFTHTLPPLGLAVLGVGIAQYLKASKVRIKIKLQNMCSNVLCL